MSHIVSILIPAYNVSKYICECLDSVVTQTYSNLQIVIVDDGSTDNTLSIAREYERKDKRIEVYHQKNAGVSTTRNNLLSHIKGEYVLFIDSDDWIEKNMVEFLVNVLESTEADIATCSTVQDTPCDSLKQQEWDYDKTVWEFLRHQQISGSLWNKLLKTSLLHNAKFNSGIYYGEDALFFWQLLKNKVKLTFTNKQLYNYRKNPVSLSRQSWTPEKKGTGHLVWSSICEDVAKDWPQYLYVAKARLALEDMWGLYFASLAGYKYDDHIKLRQINVRRNLRNITRSRLAKPHHYILAITLSLLYGGCATVKLKQIIKNIK